MKLVLVSFTLFYSRPLLMTFKFLLLVNSPEDEGGRMQTSLFHYPIPFSTQ